MNEKIKKGLKQNGSQNRKDVGCLRRDRGDWRKDAMSQEVGLNCLKEA